MTTEGGLRERKRLRTRAALQDAALGLFAERGVDATTVAQIAAAADVSPRTFFGYFPTKEAAVFADFEDDLAELAAAFAGRAPNQDALDCLRAWLAGYLADGRLDRERERLVTRLVRESAGVAARELALLARLEGQLADAIASDLSAGAADLRPRIVAAAAVAALRSLWEADEEELLGDPIAPLDEALTFLRAGLAGLLAERASRSGG